MISYLRMISSARWKRVELLLMTIVLASCRVPDISSGDFRGYFVIVDPLDEYGNTKEAIDQIDSLGLKRYRGLTTITISKSYALIDPTVPVPQCAYVEYRNGQITITN